MIPRIPIISSYANTKGRAYVLSWIHRVSGLVLVGFLWVHIYTLLNLSSPPEFHRAMIEYGSLPFLALEWLLAVPLIFHALNGGRLLLYECFGVRNDAAMTKWTVSMSAAYMLLLAVLMSLRTEYVSTLFYWLVVTPAAIGLIYSLGVRLWPVPHAITWKLQRLSGALLLVVAPSHMLFMHLNPWVATNPDVVITRIQNGFIKAVDLTLLAAASYHGAYGIASILKDYIQSRLVYSSIISLVFFIMGLFALVGGRLLLIIGLSH